jgi:hypothetical protein
MSSDLKLNLRWHVLLADGVWTEQDGHATFHPAELLDTLRVQETPYFGADPHRQLESGEGRRQVSERLSTVSDPPLKWRARDKDARRRGLESHLTMVQTISGVGCT